MRKDAHGKTRYESRFVSRPWVGGGEKGEALPARSDMMMNSFFVVKGRPLAEDRVETEKKEFIT